MTEQSITNQIRTLNLSWEPASTSHDSGYLSNLSPPLLPSKPKILIRTNSIKSQSSLSIYSKPDQLTDVCFLIDLTGGMYEFKERVIKKIRGVCERVEGRVRVGFVGYRDYGISNQTEYVILKFIEGGTEKLCNVIRNIEFRDGVDYTQDFIGGLQQALNLNWKSPCKSLILICNAPGHGGRLHDLGPKHDRYHQTPDPSGNSPEKLEGLIRVLSNKNIDFHTYRMSKVTRKMEYVIDKLLGKYGRGLEVMDFEDENERVF